MEILKGKKVKICWTDDGRTKSLFGFLEDYDQNCYYVRGDRDNALFVIARASLVSISERKEE